MRLTALLPLALGLFAAPALAGEVHFEEQAVRAIGLEPGARVAWFVVGDITHSYRRIVASSFGEVADANGENRVDLGRPVPPDSLWIAVDIGSGSVAAARSASDPVSIPLERIAPGQVRQLARESEFQMLLLVRPGMGAWTRTAEDSGKGDDDFKDDGRVTFSIDQLEPLGDSPPSPHSLRSGDIVIAADLETLAVAGMQLGN